MAEVFRSRQIWFRVFIVSGILLGVVLLVQSIATYVYVSGNLVIEGAQYDAERRALSLQRSMRRVDTSDVAALESIIGDSLADWNDDLGWVRILDGFGNVIAEGGQTNGQISLFESLRDQLAARIAGLASGTGSGNGVAGPDGQGREAGPGFPSLGEYYEIRSSGDGQVLATLVQMRQAAIRGLGRGGGGFNTARQPAYLEIAVDLEGVSASFSPLRRNLFIGVSAAIALMATMIVVGLRVPHYLRGKQLEGQIELARAVQGNLLPAVAGRFGDAEVAADCTPVSEIGGDFYDIFDLPPHALGITLGDVSGKGVAAAPLMGFIHGAAQASSWKDSPQDHERASARLNDLLYRKTAMDRFVTLFWGYFDPEGSLFRYVNAGHCPPLLLRARTHGNEVTRLEEGGSVLGALPDATYKQSAVSVEDGDLLVLYSDGIIEAQNLAREEFGEARILAAIRRHWDESVSSIRDSILADVAAFRDGAEINDDQTLVVVRFRPAAEEVSGAEDTSVAAPVA
jgi:Stage II sporulation protein E (SpoIIE)